MTDLLMQEMSLLDIQRQLEDNLMLEGVQRFRTRLQRAQREGDGSTEGGGRKLFAQAILKVEPAVQAYLDSAGNKSIAAKWIRRVGTEKAAYAVCRVVLDGIYREQNLKRVALRVAEILIDELRFRKLEREAPGLFKYKLDRFSTDHYGYKKAVLNQAIRWSEVDVVEYETTERVRLHLGSALVSIFVENTGLVVVHTVSKKKGAKWSRGTIIRATEETQGWLRQRNEWLEDQYPTHAPCVVPPLPWGEEGPGGYLYALRGTIPLLRARSSFRKMTEPTVGPVICAALNRLQETGWRVNKRVLAVVKEALASGGEVAGLPGMEPEPLPAKPRDIDENEEARKVWRKAAAQVHERNRSETGQRFEALKAVTLAEQYAAFKAFFYVWNLDFRGRCYPVADILHPQGADVARGLLQFSDAVSLGSDGGWWLMLHGANCLGEYEGQKLSQLTLDERVELIDGLSSRICEIASDPWNDRLWQDADDPWQFLAFCFEYAAWCATGQDEAFMSSLVCHVDGTANGLQHFSALLRDEDGADAVNMTVRQEPSDIYQRVADAVLTLLWKETDPDWKPYADLWLESPLPVDRKLVKRPTMTSAYGSERFGFADQILHYMRSEQDAETWRVVRKHFTVDGTECYATAARYMATLIWKALGTVVESAFEAMAWLQGCAREFSKQGTLTAWTVPITGLRVVQPYVEFAALQVRTVIAGQAWVPDSYQPKLDKPIPHEQANGVSPNFIHSLDAAALHMTVVKACAQEACSFAAIHDSFGSHAGNMALVSQTLREAFVDLHRLPILKDLADEWSEAGISPPDLPRAGRFKIDEVLSADYFFC